jgi:mRNA interferase MazF
MTTTPPWPACKRGDVVLVLFPNSNLRMARLRPALVVDSDGLNTGLAQRIVAMITSRMFRANHPSRVTILQDSPAGRQSGLLTDSIVMTDNLATVGAAAIGRVIGTLPMADIDAALRHTLHLS